MRTAIPSDGELTAEDVRKTFTERLAWRHQGRLEVGEVSEVGDNAIKVVIITRDGSLVHEITVDRETGRIATFN